MSHKFWKHLATVTMVAGAALTLAACGSSSGKKNVNITILLGKV